MKELIERFEKLALLSEHDSTLACSFLKSFTRIEMYRLFIYYNQVSILKSMHKDKFHIQMSYLTLLMYVRCKIRSKELKENV